MRLLSCSRRSSPASGVEGHLNWMTLSLIPEQWHPYADSPNSKRPCVNTLISTLKSPKEETQPPYLKLGPCTPLPIVFSLSSLHCFVRTACPATLYSLFKAHPPHKPLNRELGLTKKEQIALALTPPGWALSNSSHCSGLPLRVLQNHLNRCEANIEFK